jgi:hypothetical protein
MMDWFRKASIKVEAELSNRLNLPNRVDTPLLLDTSFIGSDLESAAESHSKIYAH